MNVAIGICTMVMGGWVLPSFNPLSDPMDSSAILGQQPSGDFGPMMPQPGAGAGESRSRSGSVRRGTSSQRDGFGSNRGGSRTQASSPLSGGGQLPVTPFAPTDPSAAADQFPWGPPTGGTGAGGEGFGQGMGIGGGTSPDPGLGGGAYQMPRRGRPLHNRYASPHAPTRERSNSFTYRKPGAQAAVAPVKPFANRRQSSGGTSAYMGLYRDDNSRGRIDNYNTVVKPRLDQQQRNSTFNSRIQGLQTTAHGQAAAIQRIGRGTQGPQRTQSTGYYMNLGGYYPGLQNR